MFLCVYGNVLVTSFTVILRPLDYGTTTRGNRSLTYHECTLCFCVVIFPRSCYWASWDGSDIKRRKKRGLQTLNIPVLREMVQNCIDGLVHELFNGTTEHRKIRRLRRIGKDKRRGRDERAQLCWWCVHHHQQYYLCIRYAIHRVSLVLFARYPVQYFLWGNMTPAITENVRSAWCLESATALQKLLHRYMLNPPPPRKGHTMKYHWHEENAGQRKQYISSARQGFTTFALQLDEKLSARSTSIVETGQWRGPNLTTFHGAIKQHLQDKITAGLPVSILVLDFKSRWGSWPYLYSTLMAFTV
jgi:hypothetical protein